MRTIRNLAARVRLVAWVLALLMLNCAMPSRSWCANLWASFDGGGGIASYTSGQLKKSGMPTPIHLSTFSATLGIAFDKSHNLWAVIDNHEVVQFTAAQLKNLKRDASPTPAVIITSTSTFSDIFGCNFDRQGNLWVVDGDKSQIDELSKTQLAAGSGNVTPAVVIFSSDLQLPNFVTFDTAGKVVSRSWWKKRKGVKIRRVEPNSRPLGGGCRRMTPWRAIAGVWRVEKGRSRI